MVAAPALVTGDRRPPSRLAKPPSAERDWPGTGRHGARSRRAAMVSTQGATPNRMATAITASCSSTP